MSRISVEDCLKNVDNRFELILVASKRARQLAKGTVEPMVDAGDEKPTIVALREIAEGYVDVDILNQVEHHECMTNRLNLALSTGHGF